MRALRVSLRMRRLPMKMMRSMIVPGCSEGGFWKDRPESPATAVSAVPFVAYSESNEDDAAAARGSRGAAASGEAANANNSDAAAIESRTRVTPNGKKTLV